MNLIIDAGNTNVKFAIFNEGSIVERKIFSCNDKMGISAYVHYLQQQHIKHVIFSSVSFEFHTFIPSLPEKWQLVLFNHQVKLPIVIDYKTPHTLGLDRIAAVVGAYHLFENKNVLIFDAGTALTIEFLNERGIYMGGNISPGIRTRFAALHSFTQKLPLVEPQIPFLQYGVDTQSAINSGVLAGFMFEVNGYIAQFSQLYENLNIIITGGEYEFFANYINYPIFAEPNLVLIGLNRILEKNV